MSAAIIAQPQHAEVVRDYTSSLHDLKQITNPIRYLADESFRSTSHVDVSTRRPEDYFERDTGLRRVAALRWYVDVMEAELSSLFDGAVKTAPIGGIAAIVRIVECVAREGVCYATAEGLKGDGEWTLDLSETVAPFSLFPGKVVILVGSVFGSQKMFVKRIVEAPLPPVAVPERTVMTPLGVVRHRVLVSTGPYRSLAAFTACLSSMEQYLRSREDKEKCAATLIILGPMVDGGAVVAGAQEQSILDQFTDYLNALEKVVEGLPHLHRVLIVPSTDEIMADAVFPQPNIDFQTSPKVCFMPNPCAIDVELTKTHNRMFRVGVCTVDAPRLMSTTFIERVDEPSKVSRMDRVLSNVVGSRLYFPYFPSVSTYPSAPAAGDMTEGASATDAATVDLSALSVQTLLSSTATKATAESAAVPNVLIWATRLGTSTGRLPNGCTYVSINTTTRDQFWDVQMVNSDVLRVDAWKVVGLS